MTDAATSAQPADPPRTDPVVSVSTGALRGTREGGLDRFLGIPYAAAPVGELRFRPPAPPAAWEGRGTPRRSARPRRRRRTSAGSRSTCRPSRSPATTS